MIEAYLHLGGVLEFRKFDKAHVWRDWLRILSKKVPRLMAWEFADLPPANLLLPSNSMQAWDNRHLECRLARKENNFT
jgi:hypothetical protein